MAKSIRDAAREYKYNPNGTNTYTGEDGQIKKQSAPPKPKQTETPSKGIWSWYKDK